MYYNNTTNLLYRTNHKCEECSHYNVCKWVDDMKKMKDKVNNITYSGDGSISPIKINVTCDMFEGKVGTINSPIKRDNDWFKVTSNAENNIKSL